MRATCPAHPTLNTEKKLDFQALNATSRELGYVWTLAACGRRAKAGQFHCAELNRRVTSCSRLGVGPSVQRPRARIPSTSLTSNKVKAFYAVANTRPRPWFGSQVNLLSPMPATCPVYPILLDSIALVIFGEVRKRWYFSLCNFLRRLTFSPYSQAPSVCIPPSQQILYITHNSITPLLPLVQDLAPITPVQTEVCDTESGSTSAGHRVETRAQCFT
jgi:hypothetical protein